MAQLYSEDYGDRWQMLMMPGRQMTFSICPGKLWVRTSICEEGNGPGFSSRNDMQKLMGEKKWNKGGGFCVSMLEESIGHGCDDREH